MMPVGVNCHPQDWISPSRDIAMLKRLGPSFVRVSALQYGVISQGNANRVKAMVDAGLTVVGLCTSETCATMNGDLWASYVQQYARLARWAGVTYDQVGNEWNTQPFWGGPPDLRKICQRFTIAQHIIGSPCIAPGVTCENKTASNKIKATTFIKAFLSETNPLAFDLHYYKSDERLSSAYDECAKILVGKTMVFLETGASNPSDQIAWYKKVCKGLWKSATEHILWYSYNAHPKFEMVDKNTTPGVLAKFILAGG